jgi:hypothetical protein
MTECNAPSCSKPARARGWCPTHYQQWRRGSQPRGEALVALPGFRVRPAVFCALRDLASERGETLSATLRWILDMRLSG